MSASHAIAHHPARDLIGRGATIGQICALLALTPRAIRFYEERGLIAPRRDERNRRIFDGSTRRRLKTIADLRRAGLPLWEIRALLNDDADEAAFVTQVRQALCVRLETLEALRQHLMRAIAALPAAEEAAEASRERQPTALTRPVARWS